MNLIIDSQYFPPIIYYKISYDSTNIIFEQCETYQKMSFRNRCQLAGAQGRVDLSIPLAGGRDQKTLMKEVRIVADRSWQVRHWRTIVSCYNRSPWFDYYRDGLETLFRQRANFLLDWNMRCFEWSLGVLGMARPVGLTDRYLAAYGPGEGADWRGKIMPGNRAEGGQGDDGQAGEMAGSGPGAPRYHQVFEERIGFIPNLSILDLLSCEGKEAIRYIRS
jgi:hypothetical protein